MDIQIQVKGVDDLVRNLRDLGVNRIPICRTCTDRDRESDAGRDDRERAIDADRSWRLAHKGTKYGINRKAATKNDLTAIVSTTAPWLIEQETRTILTPRKAVVVGDAKDLATRVKAGLYRRIPEEHPEYDQTQVEVWQRDHLSAAGERQAHIPRAPVHPAQADA